LRFISLRMRFLISCLASRVTSSLAYLPLTLYVMTAVAQLRQVVV
jgi:hypothetical protein